jgi:hypothetical protein
MNNKRKMKKKSIRGPEFNPQYKRGREKEIHP